MATIKGTSGNDTLTGTSGNDTFNVVQGGEDKVSGLEGNDAFHFNAAFDAGDQVDGGAGKDSVLLRGDYSAGVVFNATTMVNVEDITLGAGNNYSLTTADATVAAGQALFVNAAALTATDKLTFDGSGETNGAFIIEGGKGDDVLTGGAGDDSFRLYQGGEDTAHGGAGSDTFYMGAALNAGDTIDGGTGASDRNTVELNGDYSAGTVLSGTTLSNIQEIEFHSGHSYNITTADGDFAAGPTIIINGAHLSSGRVLTFNASAELDANFKFSGGAGNDVIWGGQAGDVYDLSRGGHDTARGGAGSDTFVMGGTFGANDSIDGGGGNDGIQMDGMGSASSLTFLATTMVNVENLVLLGGHNYQLSTNDANVASGQSLTLNAIRLGASDTLTFDGSAETDGSFTMTAGAGNATLTGGAQADVFNITRGGVDTIHGGGGADIITAAGTLTGADKIDGGTGSDTLKLNGDYASGISFSDATITSIETLSLAVGHSYKFTSADANVASGATMTVDATALGATDTVNFNASFETDGTIAVKGGAGNDAVTFGAHIGTFDGGAGNDTLTISAASPFISDSAFTHVETLALAVPFGSSLTSVTVLGDITGGGGVLHIDTTGIGAGKSANVFTDAATTPVIDYNGGAGADFLLYKTFNISDQFVGGGGSNTVDFSAGQTGFAISATNFTNLNNISFAGAASGFSVVGDLTQGTSSAGTLSVNTGSGAVSIDFSGTTTAAVNFTGGAGDDTVIFSGDKANWGNINGGGGNNTFEIKDGAGTVLDQDHIDNVSTVKFDNGFSYSGYSIKDDLTGGKGTLHVDASALTGANSLSIDLSKTTTATLDFLGGAGDDAVTFGANISHAGTVDGGAGTNTLSLTGNGQDVVTNFAGASFSHFDHLALVDGDNYDITATSGFAGNTIKVDASALTNWDATLDVSGLSGTTVDFTGGAGNDTLVFGANLADAGTIDGGTGTNTVQLNGAGTDVTGSFSATTFSHFTTLSFVDGNNYDVTITGATASGATLTIDASQLTGFGATADASALSSGVTFTGGQGDDAITVSSGALAGDTIDGGSAGNDTLTVDNSGATAATISVTDSTVHDIDTLDLTGAAFTATVSGDLTSGTGTGTLTIDASGASSVSLDLSNDTATGFAVTGSAGDDTITISGFFSGTIDGGDGHNTLEVSGANTGGELNSTNITGFDKVVYAPGTAAGNGFVGDLTGNGGTLTVDASLADGTGGSGPDSDMATFSFDALTSGLVFIGTAIDDYLSLSSKIWTSLDGNGGNYNAIAYTGTGAITFDDTTITGFNALAFGTDFNGDALAFSGIKVVGDLTGNGGTVAIDASESASIAIDVSQATSSIGFTGGAGDDTISFGNTFSASDTVAGGGGGDTLSLGRNTADLADTAVTGVDTVTLSGSSGFAVTGDITSGGGTLTVDASASTDNVHGNVNIDFSSATTAAIDVTGGAAADRFTFNAGSGNWGTVDGGGGSNNFLLAGGGSATIDGASVTDFGTVVLKDGGSYTVTLKGDITGDGSKLTVDASQLTNSNNASVDASNSTDKIGFTGSAGNDSFTGSSHGDTIDITGGGFDTVTGGAGDDSIKASATWISDDSINGGTGNNTLTVTGSDVEFGGTNASNIQTLVVVGDLTLSGDIAGTAGALTIDHSGATLFHEIDISQATTTVINVTGGSADDYVDYNAFNSADKFVGGNGYNEVGLAANEAGFTISSANFTALDEFDITGSTDQTFTVTGDVSQGGDNAGFFDIWAHDDTGNLTFDMTAATTASLEVEGGKGDDTIKLTTAEFNIAQLIGNGGNDTVTIQGSGTDFVSRTIVTANNQDIAKYVLSGANDFTMTFGAGLAQVTHTLTVDASALTVGHTAYLDFGAANTGTIDVTGGAGNDTIIVNAAHIGTIDGGANDALDQNVLELHGGNSTVTLSGYTGDDNVTPQISNIEKLVLDDGASYSLIIDGALAKTQGSLHLDASALTGSNALTLDATQTGAGASYITGGAGDDVISVSGGSGEIDGHEGNDTVSVDGYVGLVNGGEGSDTLNLGTNSSIETLDSSSAVSIEKVVLTVDQAYTITVNGDISGDGTLSLDASALSNGTQFNLEGATTAAITVTGGSGDDLFNAGAHLAAMTITGGGGDDVLDLDGDYSTVVSLANVSGVGALDLETGHSYALTTADGTVGAGATFTVDGSLLGAGDVLTFDGSAETDGYFDITGGAGNDVIKVGSTLAGSTIDGGGGTNTLSLDGDYSAGVTLSMINNISEVDLAGGHSYSITTVDANVAQFDSFKVDGNALGTSDVLTFDGSAESDQGIYNIVGGAGDDVLTGGNGFDNFYLMMGGEDTVHGGDGADTIYANESYSAGDVFDGGADQDDLWLANKDYTGGDAITFGANQLISIEAITLGASHAYSLTMNDGNVAAGDTMFIDGVAAKGFTFNGAAETDGHFLILSSTSPDVLTGGALSDTFAFDAVSFTQGKNYDTITNIDFGSDKIWLGSGTNLSTDYQPTGIDTAVTTGSLSTASFVTDLTSDLTGHLAGHHAVLFTADAGTLSGDTFLVVDANGTAGYQNTGDYVIEVTGYTGTLALSSFT